MRFKLSRSRRVASRTFWSVLGVPAGDYVVIERNAQGRDYWVTIDPLTASRSGRVEVFRAESLRAALALVEEVYAS